MPEPYSKEFRDQLIATWATPDDVCRCQVDNLDTTAAEGFPLQ